jgi:hypothetical protein
MRKPVAVVLVQTDFEQKNINEISKLQEPCQMFRVLIM